ncbi:MAG: hypothetical protein ACI8QS_000610 [Planctomycetota bacterium]|jgi:hypothetical protein
MISFLSVVLAALPLAAPAPSVEPAVTATAALDDIVLESYQLVLNLDIMGDLEETTVGQGSQIKLAWNGTLAEVSLAVRLVVLPKDFGLGTALSVVELLEENAESDEDDGAFEISERLEGKYGWSGAGWFAVSRGEKSVDRIVIAGALKEQGYFIELLPRSAAGDDFIAAARELAATGVRYTGPSLDPNWTEEEVEQRWEEIAPDRVKEQGELGVFRTKHYIILTNMRANGGTVKKFGKKMEERYEEIRDVYPFEDLPNGRLLAVYLFQTPAQYHAFLEKVLDFSPEQARRTAGIAYKDFYSTSYAAPSDPVHKHEAVHQIFSNVLRLSGGGSWFQEGVAEYAEGKKNDRKPFRTVVKSEKNMPLRDFFALESLIFSQDVDVKNGDSAGDSYLQAGCVIEFAAEHKPIKKLFEEFVHRMGALRRNDIAGIEAVLKDLYGQTLEEFEEDLLAYWRKR